mmetsp:Transcript_32079/g.48788  ORF Transcript_32079/g.48788 Transcript_32079/m.48788 type:complete len:511 (+) Transcript_32079:134-1666(+)
MVSVIPKSKRRQTGAASVSSSTTLIAITLFAGFVIGCFVCSIVLLSLNLGNHPSSPFPVEVDHHSLMLSQNSNNYHNDVTADNSNANQQLFSTKTKTQSATTTLLSGLRILIAIAAYDFSQLPHLEEVLDAYGDLCAAGAYVDLIIHTTVPYPIALIDLLNTRLVCQPPGHLQVTIALVSPTVRLHLVDVHRPLFYEKLHEYDLFIYTEDDIRITPKLVASYLHETRVLQETLGYKESLKYNVGIVRYEYNFPSNVAINDKTRHATQNVTRVYWEHSYEIPAVPKAVDAVKMSVKGTKAYVHMKNHHQGMFLATPELLQAWKDKEECKFDVVTNRPGAGSQPKEGTQRVWMSSQQLYAPRHCGIQQVIPIDQFGSLTALHLPNKNYRRVGHFRNRTFSDGTETFDFGGKGLLTAMALHMELLQLQKAANQQKPQVPYRGIIMDDSMLDRKNSRWGYELKKKFSQDDYFDMVDRRMKDFHEYVKRGGILTEEDWTKTDLVDVLPDPEYRNQ